MAPAYSFHDSFFDDINNFRFDSGFTDPYFDPFSQYDQQPILPITDDNSRISTWFPTLSDENGDHLKRLKMTLFDSLDTISSSSSVSSSETDGISRTSSTNSINSFSGLKLRDQIWAYSPRNLAVEEAGACFEGEDNGDGMKMVQLLISCAEAVACRDKSHASVLLTELRTKALVFGSSFQRVASCFVQGLAERLDHVQPLGTVGYVTPKMNIMDVIDSDYKRVEALRLVYEVCPYIRFGHFVANSSILEAFEGENFVHVVDLGMTLGLPHGHQWRNLIHSLAARPGPPPRRVRITAVGLCVQRIRAIGDELEGYARGLGINFEFFVVESNLENLKPENIKVTEGEALVVNSILQLHCVVKESRGAVNAVLQTIHELSPKVLVLVEQDSSHNGPFFLGRFMEALHYYSAIFDSIDAMLPKYDTRRAKIEQFYYAEEIKNIVSCEGPGRLERHERVDQWRRRMSRAGFQAGPMKINTAEAKMWLGKIKGCEEGYTVVEEKGCLVLGWKSKPIVAASCWKC